jgi:hypothetical protein
MRLWFGVGRILLDEKTYGAKGSRRSIPSGVNREQ